MPVPDPPPGGRVNLRSDWSFCYKTHCTLTQCTLHTHTVHTTQLTQYTLHTHTVHTAYSHSTHCTLTQYTLHTHTVHTAHLVVGLIIHLDRFENSTSPASRHSRLFWSTGVKLTPKSTPTYFVIGPQPLYLPHIYHIIHVMNDLMPSASICDH